MFLFNASVLYILQNYGCLCLGASCYIQEDVRFNLSQKHGANVLYLLKIKTQHGADRGASLKIFHHNLLASLTCLVLLGFV